MQCKLIKTGKRALLMNIIPGKVFCKQGPLAFVLGLAFFLAIVLSTQYVYATHAAGAELTYTHLSGNDYRVTATFYRDCGGVSEPASVVIKYRSASMGFNSTVVAIKDTSSGQEITVNCASVISTCNGGTSPGIRKFVYVATVTLPQQATDWIFSFYVCCRNCSITTIATPCASNSLIYVEATLNNLVAANNNSPVFSNLPVAFICIGQNFTYNHGVIDADGDSLTYELVTPKINDSTNVTFISPNSANAPIQSSTPFTLNTSTGSLNFTPTQQQIGIFAFKINEFRNGVLIGSVIRDMQVYTIPCINSLPTASGINSTSNYSLNACVGSNNCFTIQTADADIVQSISVSSNIAQTIPGAFLNITTATHPVLNFCWTPTAADVRALPYTFTVTVRDNACPGNGTQTFTYSINVSGPQASITTTSAACNGGNGGTATVQTINSGLCTYQWSTVPAQTGATAINLLAGNYTVTVTDMNGCSISQQAIVAQASIINIAANVTQIGCSGQSNGSIVLNVNGGATPYSYLWSNGATTSNVSSLTAGTYTVTVSDSSGCYQNQSYIILQPQPVMQITVNVSNPILCNATDVSAIDIAVTGGTLPLMYNWSNGATSQDLLNIHSGVYSCIITDANGCTVNVQPVTIQQSSTSLNAVVSYVQNISCSNLNSGMVSTMITGGISPYSFLWSNNTTNKDLVNVPTGSYTLTVTDSIGCTKTISANVNGPTTLLNVSGTSENIKCYGDSTGKINIVASGGIPPYTYAWTNGAALPLLTQLTSGNYKVYVTDSYGCSRDSIFNITQPASSLINNVISAQITCYGLNNGSASVTSIGGTAPYSYLWSNGSTGSSLVNLSPGNYAITVTDVNGCVSSSTAMIAQPLSPLLVTSSTTDANCLKGEGGSLTVNTIGGTMPYSYTWSNGMTTASLTNVQSGVYHLTVTDGNGCVSDLERTIRDFSVLAVHADGPTEFCVGGLVKLNTDEIESATYQWYQDGQTLTGAVSSSFITPASGAYTVAVNNSCGTFVSSPINVKVNSIGNYYVSPNVIICPSAGETTTLAAYGGSFYKWDPGYGLSDSTIASPIATPLVTTKYSVSITSNEGCSVNGEVTVTVVCDSLLVPTGFTPDGNTVNDTYVIKGIEKYAGNNLFIYNRWGNLVYKKKNYNNSWDGTCNVSGINLGQQLPNGTYFYILDLNDGKKPLQGYITLKK